MSSYLIQPYNQVVSYKIIRIEILISNMELGVKAGITTNFYDEIYQVRRSEFAILEGQEYQDWTTDDYLVNWVCNKYGIVILSGV